MVYDFTERFVEWQNYVHYMFLALGVFWWHSLSLTGKLELVMYSGNFMGWMYSFAWYTLGLFVVDTVIHALFWALPEPLRWRD